MKGWPERWLSLSAPDSELKIAALGFPDSVEMGRPNARPTQPLAISTEPHWFIPVTRPAFVFIDPAFQITHPSCVLLSLVRLILFYPGSSLAPSTDDPALSAPKLLGTFVVGLKFFFTPPPGEALPPGEPAGVWEENDTEGAGQVRVRRVN